MNEHVDELLGLYALGGLEADELERVEAHLTGCAACQKEAGALQALASVVAQSAVPVEPYHETRARLLKQIRATQARPQVASRAIRWAPLALSTVLAVALLGWNLSLNNQLNHLQEQVAAQQQVVADLREQTEEQTQVVRLVTSPAIHAVDLAGQGDLLAAGGRAYVDQTSQAVALIVNHLPPLGEEQTYQAWIIPSSGQPISAGMFSVNDKGWGMYALDMPAPPVDFDAIGVSLEPAGGSLQPTKVVLVGGL